MFNQNKTICLYEQRKDGRQIIKGAVWLDQFRKLLAKGDIDKDGKILNPLFIYPVTKLQAA